MLGKITIGHATETGKQSSSPPLVITAPDQEGDYNARRTEDKQSHEEGELSPENSEFLNNGHDIEAKFSKPAKQPTHFDDSNDNRFHFFLVFHLNITYSTNFSST